MVEAASRDTTTSASDGADLRRKGASSAGKQKHSAPETGQLHQKQGRRKQNLCQLALRLSQQPYAHGEQSAGQCQRSHIRQLEKTIRCCGTGREYREEERDRQKDSGLGNRQANLAFPPF